MEGQVHQDQVRDPASYTLAVIRVLLQPSAVHPRAIPPLPGEQVAHALRFPRLPGTRILETEIKSI